MTDDYDTLDIAGGRTATIELQRLMCEGDTLSATTFARRERGIHAPTPLVTFEARACSV